MLRKIQSKLQTFSGAMMVPIILLVLVGFYVGIGSAFTNYILEPGTALHTLMSMITNLGFMFMNNLPLWFTIGIAFTLAKKEKGWAAFVSVIMYLCFVISIQSFASVQGWTSETTAIESLVANGFSEMDALNFNSLWTTSLGYFTYNMGIFSGIIVGLVTVFIHNKFIDTELPNMFNFFAGPKMVVIISTLVSIPLALVTYYTWPPIANLIASITNIITESGLFGTFLFGTLDKMLLPLGLHHLIAFPIEYSAVGGTMMIDGVLYEGVRNIILGQAGSPNATGYIVRNFTTGRILFQLAGLPGASLAIYHLAKPENKKKVASLLIPAVLTLAVVGISEPIEYTFLFLAPQLYFFIYAPLTGLMYVLAEIFKISINGNALLFMIPNLFQPHKVHAMPLLFLLPLAFILYYFIFKTAIVKLDLNTPGRKDSEAKLISKKEYRELKDNDNIDLEYKIIEALGGKENIKTVTNCATRLRVQVESVDLVAPEKYWMDNLDAFGVVEADNSLQIIYGVKVITIATKVREVLGIE